MKEMMEPWLKEIAARRDECLWYSAAFGTCYP
jgi:hypothetical protein